MMNRRFTTREKVLLLVCAVLLLGIFYYKFVYVDSIEAAKRYDTTSLEDELSVTQLKAAKMNQMREELASGESDLNGEVTTYNNLQNEISLLNNILAGADTYNLDFADATLTGDTVRRDISVSFHTGSYEAAKTIVTNLSNCQYRCMIKDMNLSTTSSQSTGINSSSDLNVSFTVTFYETTNGAATTAGLVVAEDAGGDTGTADK